MAFQGAFHFSGGIGAGVEPETETFFSGSEAVDEDSAHIFRLNTDPVIGHRKSGAFLKWEPRHSSLENMLNTTWAVYRKYG